MLIYCFIISMLILILFVVTFLGGVQTADKAAIIFFVVTLMIQMSQTLILFLKLIGY